MTDQEKHPEPDPELHQEIVVAGGGPVGLTLTLGLALAGFDVALIDRAPLKALANEAAEETYDGRATALSLASLRLLRRLGLGDILDREASPIWRISVSDGRLGEAERRESLGFDARDLGQEPLGAVIENRLLRAALHQALLAKLPATRLYEQQRIAQLDAAKAGRRTLHLASGTACTAALILSVDGRHSTLRQAAQLADFSIKYGQAALVASLRHERPHKGCAFEHFLPAGPFAVLPLNDAPHERLPEHRASLVWTDRADKIAAYAALDEEAFNRALVARFGERLGQLYLDGKRWSYPLSAHQAPRFISERLALVGDAAHGVHPIAGQGFNTGLKDVAALLDVLEDARRLGQDLGSQAVLQQYQRWRRFDAGTLLLATHGLNGLFSNDYDLVRLARGLGLSGVNRLPGLKKLFMRRATGTLGRIPRRMQA
jgi:2-octaprenyl-6-methoxyphenol hydroxylase